MPSTTPFDVEPAEALRTIRSFSGDILVDLDETLYLQNSTEDFIDSASPRILARLLIKFLDILKPWRVTGGHATRDVWRLACIRIVFPWTGWLWRRRIHRASRSLLNQELHQALADSNQNITILTVGFTPVVKPLITALGYRLDAVIAANPWSFKDRRNGKLWIASRRFSHDALRKSLLITDSIDDVDILEKCGQPLRVIWPAARYRPALTKVYIPGEYLSKIKRPRERYIWRAIIQEDLFLWTLSSVPFAATVGTHIIGLALLCISFWTIYELGYVDNDQAAVKFEKDPKLSETFGCVEVETSFVKPWLWAIPFGIAGTIFLQHPMGFSVAAAGKWIAVLLATYGCFWLYNRIDKLSRTWLYVWLQFGRSAAFAILVPITLVGAIGLASNTLARWVPYFVYRHAGKKWPGGKPEIIRLVIFLLLAVLILFAQGSSAVINWSAAVFLTWGLFRARHELRGFVQSIERLDRDGTKPV